MCFSWDFTLWLLGMLGMQQKIAGMKADLNFKLKCAVFLGKEMPTKLLWVLQLQCLQMAKLQI